MNDMTSHGVDMHGGNSTDSGEQAGENIWIHHNYFIGSGWKPAIAIRGRPKDNCIIEDNNFADYINEENAIRQKNTFGNFKSRRNNFKEDNKGLYVSWGGDSNWYRIATMKSTNANELGFVKFTADYGMINFTGLDWSLYNFSNSNGTVLAGGTIFQSNNLTVDDVDLGDFDGDGKTDVFWADGQQWYAAYSGFGPWEDLASSGYPLSQLGFGDFNGDGKTDVFRANGQQWRPHYSGRHDCREHRPVSTTFKIGQGL